jgi:cob(I)alamin adenosyltransferase
MGEFLKSDRGGELESLVRLPAALTPEKCGCDQWVRPGDGRLHQRWAAQNGLVRAPQILLEGEYDLVVLDEINTAAGLSLLLDEEVLELLDANPSEVELILTGRWPPPALIERADLVTEMREVRHPPASGIRARAGVDF